MSAISRADNAEMARSKRWRNRRVVCSAWLTRSCRRLASAARACVVAVDGDQTHGSRHRHHRHVDGAGHALRSAVARSGLDGGDGGVGHEVDVGPGDALGVGGEDDRAVHLGQLREPLGAELCVEEEPPVQIDSTSGPSPTAISAPRFARSTRSIPRAAAFRAPRA